MYKHINIIAQRKSPHHQKLKNAIVTKRRKTKNGQMDI